MAWSMLLLLPSVASAQSAEPVAPPEAAAPAAPAPDADPIAAAEEVAVRAELDALKDRVRALERQLDDANQAAAAEASQEVPLDLETKVHGYAAINAITYEGNPLGVALDQFVIGYSANLDRRYTFSSEISYEPGETETPLDVESLEVKLSFNDALQVVVGRSNAPYSQWADTALHGAFRYTPVVLPEILSLEGEDGLIPMHLGGVQARGVLPIGFWQLGYVADVSNGRSPLLAGVAQVGDTSWSKALLGRLWVESPGGVRFGVAGSYDRIEPFGEEEEEEEEEATLEEVAGLAVDESTTELIAAASLSHSGGRLELLSEGFLIVHEAEGGNPVHNYAAYGLVGYRIKKIEPYLIVDSKILRASDPIYSRLDEVASEVKGSLGVRYDFGLRVALKGQVDRVHEVIYTGPEATDGPGGTVEDSLGVHLQLAAGF